MKVVKGGESKKESLVKSSMFMVMVMFMFMFIVYVYVYCLCLCLVMGMGMDMEVGKCRHMSSLIKSRGVKC